MKRNIDIFGRSALYLLALAFAVAALAVVWVVQAQVRTIMSLSGQVQDATTQVIEMREEVARVSAQLQSTTDSDRHIAVALRENKLYLMEGNDAIRTMTVASGSGRKMHRYGHDFDFSTPPGRYVVTRKETDPVWIAPDWNWYEKGQDVPDTLSLQDRTFRGHLGKYRLMLKDGIGIHGTNELNSIGRYVTHGCIRVGAKDLEILFNAVDSGTPVYIY